MVKFVSMWETQHKPVVQRALLGGGVPHSSQLSCPSSIPRPMTQSVRDVCLCLTHSCVSHILHTLTHCSHTQTLLTRSHITHTLVLYTQNCFLHTHTHTLLTHTVSCTLLLLFVTQTGCPCCACALCCCCRRHAGCWRGRGRL